MIITCSYCNNKSDKPTGHVNRAKSKNKPLYCNKICNGLARRIDINISTKKCTSCNKILNSNQFRTRTNSRNIIYKVARCFKCELYYNKIQIDIENRKARNKIRLSDPIKKNNKNNRQRNWVAQNIEKNRKYHQKHIKKHVDSISNSYIIRSHFREYPKNIIPNELIEAIRQVLKNKRLIKTKK